MSNYLYNGLELPKLPDRDIEKYPYVIISNEGQKNFPYYGLTLVFISQPAVYSVIMNGSINASYVGTTAMCEVSTYLYSSGKWTFSADKSVTEVNSDNYYFIRLAKNLVWSNYDVLNQKGSVYLPASYPIDAETGEEIRDYEIGGEPEQPVPTLTARDLYRNVNGQLVKHTLYKKINNKLVALDEHYKEVTNE